MLYGRKCLHNKTPYAAGKNVVDTITIYTLIIVTTSRLGRLASFARRGKRLLSTGAKPPTCQEVAGSLSLKSKPGPGLRVPHLQEDFDSWVHSSKNICKLLNCKNAVGRLRRQPGLKTEHTGKSCRCHPAEYSS